MRPDKNLNSDIWVSNMSGQSIRDFMSKSYFERIQYFDNMLREVFLGFTQLDMALANERYEKLKLIQLGCAIGANMS